MTDVAQRNAEQVEYWGGAGGERWVAQQSRRDAMLGNFAAKALMRAMPSPGEMVLDVGCGCGETAAMLADAVAPTGKVTGVDVSRPILAAARERLAGHPDVQLIHADAASYPFPAASFDLIFSRFGVMFFADPVAAFTNLRRAIKPDGRLVFVCWRSPAENGWMTAPMRATADLLPAAVPVDPGQPGPFAFQEQEKVADVLVRAGFANPVFERLDTLVDVAGGRGCQAAVESAMELGPTARALDGADELLRATIAERLRTFFAPKVKKGAVHLPAATWIVTANAQ
ncbi:MAG TPA: class I SAM-dependent methyltransferase [Caulobacteraceae bacterium]|nr:class I SAM-dependent methyltransferase [Caulobacteraceae bacterium]